MRLMYLSLEHAFAAPARNLLDLGRRHTPRPCGFDSLVSAFFFRVASVFQPPNLPPQPQIWKHWRSLPVEFGEATPCGFWRPPGVAVGIPPPETGSGNAFGGVLRPGESQAQFIASAITKAVERREKPRKRK